MKAIDIRETNLPEAYFDGVSVLVPKLEDESEEMYQDRKQFWIRHFMRYEK